MPGWAVRLTAPQLPYSAACAARQRVSRYSNDSLPSLLAPSEARARVVLLYMICSGMQDYALMACFMTLDPIDWVTGQQAVQKC